MIKFLTALGAMFFIIILGIAAFLYWPEKAYTPYQVPEAYQSQVDAYHVPAMPDDWQWSSFTTKDGTSLRWGQTGNSGTAETTLLLVPGYTATLDMYGEHIDILAERGFHVVGLDLRGQGGSDRYFIDQPEKLWIGDFLTYSDDVADFISAQTFEAERNVIPIGISFGGHVVLRMAAKHAEIIDGLVLVAPAIEPKANDYEFNRALQLMNAMRKIGLSKKYVFGGTDWRPVGTDFSVAGIDWCSSEPKRLFLRDAIFTTNPELRVGGVTNQWGAEFFESSQVLKQPGFFERMSVPVLMFSADQDDFVSTSTNEAVCKEALARCENIHYPETGHCLPQETDEVVFDILENIEKFASKLQK